MTGRRDAAGPRPPLPRVDASMSLLNELMYRPVDGDYADAARSPRAPATGPVRVVRFGLLVAVATALGLLTASAVVSLRTPQPSAIGARTLLEQQIEDRTAEADELQAANDRIATEIAEVQANALAAADPALFDRLQDLEVASGAVALQGPGLVLELTDAPAAEQQEGGAASLVQDVDLQIVTNGLWAAGAEAIAVNGERLTALSAIRSVGPAILVDLVALASPYRIEVIGDPQAIQTAFARTTAANHLTTLSGTYGIESSLRAAQLLTVPGSGPATLRYATVPRPDVASSVPAAPSPGSEVTDETGSGGAP